MYRQPLPYASGVLAGLAKMLVRRDVPWIGLAALLIGLLAAALCRAPRRINHDCALYLHQAELLLDGGVPYVDFVDTNPPLIVYLNVPPVLLSRAVGVSAATTFHGLLLLLLIVSTAEIYFLLGGGRQITSRFTRGTIPFFLRENRDSARASIRPSRRTPAGSFRAYERGVILLVWIAISFLIWRRCELGQREHLFVLLYVPYLFLRIARYQENSAPVWFAVLLGFQAGVGVSIKPHFLILAVLVEIILLASARRRRTLWAPENIAASAVVIAYVGHWLFVPAAMREAFFGRWLPMIRGGYAAYDVSYGQIAQKLLHSPTATILVLTTLLALAVAVGYRFRRRVCFEKGTTGCLSAGAGRQSASDTRADKPPVAPPAPQICATGLSKHVLGVSLPALGGFAAGSLALIFVQKKGWSYHAIPFETAAGMATALLAVLSVRVLHRANPHRSYRSGFACTAFAAGCLLFIVVLIASCISRQPAARQPPAFAALQGVIEQRTKPGDRVLFIATSVRPAYPMLLQLDRKPGSRYLCSFPIALFYGHCRVSAAGEPLYRRRADAPPAEQRFLAELEADVARLRPRLVIIPDFPGGMGLPEHFNHSDYLSHSGWTERALEHYRELPGPEGWKVFELP